MNTLKKQFIAGAVCPNCKAMDKIQLVREISHPTQCKTYYECLACGYLRSDTEFDTTDLGTQPVKLMQGSKGKNKKKGG